MIVTLDTNILISGTFWSGSSFKVMKLIDDKIVEVVLSKEILSEYHHILESEEIIDKIDDKKLIISKISQKVIMNAKIVAPKNSLNIVRDSKDNIILECAKEGEADYIITKDNDLLVIKEFEGIKIITPEDLLELF